MPLTIDEPDAFAQLRYKAEAQLESGTTSRSGHWTMGVDALRLLHRLSSIPENAEDALKLLHELQVHQVELDLQNEEIVSYEQVLVEDLLLYRALFDCAPLPYFLVDVKGTILQGNLAAAELCNVIKDDLEGLSIDSLVPAQNRSILHALLKQVATSGSKESCTVRSSGSSADSRLIQFQASPSPKGEHIMLVCCEYNYVE